MDEAAVALEIDPLELRLAHLGDEQPRRFRRGRGADRVDAGPGSESLGIAGGIEKDARVATAVELRVGEDRRPRLTRIVTAFDCGRIVEPEALTTQNPGRDLDGPWRRAIGACHFDALRVGLADTSMQPTTPVPRMSDLPAME